MGLLLSNYKHVETKIEWNHGANSNQLYRPEGSLTGGEASLADNLRTMSISGFEQPPKLTLSFSSHLASYAIQRRSPVTLCSSCAL
jgi:hypothetical protein